MTLYYYSAQVLNVVDGDTFDIDVDMGFHTHNHIRIRVLGIDTPETKITKGVDEKEYGNLAKAFARKILLNRQIYVHTVSQDSFGRWLADVYLHDGTALLDVYNLYGINKLSDTYSFDNFESVVEVLNNGEAAK